MTDAAVGRRLAGLNPATGRKHVGRPVGVAPNRNPSAHRRHVVAKIWPGAGADMIPDVVILTEGTGDADVTITSNAETFEQIASGDLNPTSAYMSGKLKIKGDMGAAMKLQKLF